ncbi:MAG: UDP-N-acetylglucosamine 2-epimerase [Pirellulales bacterium]|nr:UDP-N-acetylglucosamine 2-epimerase [Pirellulales bacterium]
MTRPSLTFPYCNNQGLTPDCCCLTLRPNTERPVTITQGTNKLSIPEKIGADLKKVMEKSCKTSPLFWDGKTAERVVEVMKKMFGSPFKS